MRNFIGIIVLAALVLATGACGKIGGNNITSPSDLERNLNSAPSGAFEIANAEITVRFWFDITPPPGSAVTPSEQLGLTLNCRANSGVRYGLRLGPPVWIGLDGSIVDARAVGLPIDLGGLFTTDCAPGNTLGHAFQTPKFPGLREVRFQANLDRGDGGSPTVANFVQPLNWTLRQ